jgi:hypothetical protein
MQNKFAGTNPNWEVRRPIRQIITLFAPARIQPCHNFLPTSKVETTVSAHEM